MRALGERRTPANRGSRHLSEIGIYRVSEGHARAQAADGAAHSLMLGTFFMRKTGAEHHQGGKTRDIDLHSMIYRHIKDTEHGTWIVEGLGAWARLAEMASSYVRSTIVKDPDVGERVFAKTVSMTRKPMIEPMNYACDFLGCGSIDVKPDGTLWVHRYIEPAMRPVVWTFEDGANCSYSSDIIIDTNEDDMPNAVRVFCEKDGTVYNAQRVLPSSSPYSLEQRGLHVVADYVHNELGEAADKGIQAAVNRKCNEYYERMLSLAVSVQIEHPYAPVRPGDAVRFRRGSADFVGIVHAMQTELSEGLMTKTSIDVIGGALGETYP